MVPSRPQDAPQPSMKEHQQRINRLKKNRWVARLYKASRSLMTTISPTLNTLITFRVSKGQWPNLIHPRTFNEKVSWLKLHVYNHSDIVRSCADKLAVREYVAACGLDQILVPLLGVYENPDRVPWDALPDSFVLKTNTGSGGNYICTDRSTADTDAARKLLWKAFKSTKYKQNAELQYKGTKPKILCETALLTKQNQPPTDYKIYCSYGRPISLLAVLDRFGEIKQKRYLNTDDPGFAQAAKDLDIPEGTIREMTRISKILSRPFPHVRVDLYLFRQRIYFSELTFTPAGGIHSGLSVRFDDEVGAQIHLPKDKGMSLRNASFESLLRHTRDTYGAIGPRSRN